MRIICIFFLLAAVSPVLAQSEFALYRMNGNLAQANLINPAFAPNNKVVIGLPVISSLYGSVSNAGIAFRDVFRNSETNMLQVDTASLFTKLKATQRMQLKESIQLFYFGLRGKRSYFSLGIHQVSETRLNYPGDLIGWAIRGPGDSHYAGKSLDIGNFYGRSIAYNKVSINYARDITSKLRVGARFNYLLGVAAGQTTKGDGTLSISTDSVSINTGALQAQTAGVDFFRQSSLGVKDYTSYLLHPGNTGMSWDFGGTYELTERLTLSAAVNDLGYINWKNYTRSYDVDPIHYTFRGFDLLDYLNSSSGQKFIENQVDSVKNLAKSRETQGGTFKTSLVGKVYAGINFKILKVNNFSALVYFDMFHARIDPAVSLGYNIQLGRLLNTTVGLTYQDGKINNVSAGIALKLLNLQIYAASDRANSFLYPARASRADVHTGINLVFGKAKKNKDHDDDKDKESKEDKQEPKKEEVKPLPQNQPQETQQPVSADTVAQVTEPPLAPSREDTARVVPQDIQPQVTSSEAPVNKETVTTNEPAPPPVAQKETAPAKEEEPVMVRAVRDHEVVKKGTHPDELAEAHYVIVGTFKQKGNAQQYSNRLRAAGHNSAFGFITMKQVYYVYVYKSASLETARLTRDQFRKLSDFQFSQSWVLSVEK
jgi:cell division protein FtsN